MRRIVLLGATGSIGASALEVIEDLGAAYQIVALSCGSDWPALSRIAERVRPEAVAIASEIAWRQAREAGAFGSGVTCLGGPSGLTDVAGWDTADTVLNGIVGAAGLPATLAALAAGKRVLLANKESLVVGGELVMAAAGGTADGPAARLLPVDSEHNALWQLLEHRPPETIEKLILTASGGPFRTAPTAGLADVTPADALAHPTWSMGPKITIDSATLANKGLEIIEAHHLFGIPYDRIDVVIHPQSIVHGLIELTDGSLFAELGAPDMRAPIRSALTWPERVASSSRFSPAQLGTLTFEAPDPDRFPMLGLARTAGETAGTAPAVFNAANEVAVAAFLAERIGFLDIAAVCEAVLSSSRIESGSTLEALLAADRSARDEAERVVAEIAECRSGKGPLSSGFRPCRP